jgi:hypothetical protein
LQRTLSTIEILIEGIETAFDVKLRRLILATNQRSRVYSALRASLSGADSHRCMASIVLGRLRRTMTSLLKLLKDSIRLDTPLDLLVSLFHRRRYWRVISERSGLHLPDLGIPRLLAALLTLVAITPAFATLVSGKGPLLYIVLFLASPFFGAALLRLARRGTW